MSMKRLLLILLCAMLLFSMALAEERLPDEVLYTYYDNCLIVGDSLVVDFRLFVRRQQATDPAFFAGVKFYAADSYLLHSASVESLIGVGPELRYNGMDASLAWIMEKVQPRRVFIHAGSNDGVYNDTDRAGRYIDRIMALRDKFSPGTEMCFFSMTPVVQKFGAKRQQVYDAYNAWLEEKCAEVGAVYVDIATGLKGEDGFLPDELCYDGEFHLNSNGNAVWAQELLDYAQSQYEAGLWDPAEAD